MNIAMTECLNDTQYIDLARAGDVRGFAYLHDCHYEAIYNFVYFRVDEVTVAEDITAEVFVRMVKMFDKYRKKQQTILPWLYTIARNLVTDHYRKKARKPDQVSIEEMELASSEKSPEHILSSQMDSDCLKKAIYGLTDIQQQVIVSKFIEERSNEEVAELMDRTVGSVKSLQHRALSSLQRMIEKAGCYEF